LNDLDADGSRAARDWLMDYAKVVKSAQWRERAFASIAKIGGRKGIEFLCGKSGARSTDSLIQREAVDALGKQQDRGAVGPLLEVLGDASLKMETVAAVCLALGKTAPDDEKVRAALMKTANDHRDTVRAAAIEALGWVRTDDAYSFVTGLLAQDHNAA